MNISGQDEFTKSCPHSFKTGEEYTLRFYHGMCHHCGKEVDVKNLKVRYVRDDTMGIALIHKFDLVEVIPCPECGRMIINVAVYCDPAFQTGG